MAAITQSIPTFLGGVSRQSDTKKKPGQVNEILNGYPDPTYGLLKRNGSQFLGTLATYVNDPSDTLKDGYWFSIARDNDERYIGVITTTGNIRIWNTVPSFSGNQLVFTEATIANKTDADVVAYLTKAAGVASSEAFHTFTYLDQTYVINKNTNVLMNAKSNYYLRARATVILGSIDYDQEYAIWVGGTKCSFTTVDVTTAETRGDPVDADEILSGLKTDLEAKVGTNYNIYKYSNSLEIERKDGQTPFTIEVKAGIQGVSLTSYQDEVTSSARLAAFTKPGRRVKILNSIDERASYYVKFVATGNATGDTTSAVNAGSGYWEEDRGWDIDVDQSGLPVSTGGKFIAQLASTGFNAQTMPYKIRSTGTNTFTIGKETWAPRLTGNDYGNPVPSFVGTSIKFGLVYSNRLVLLTADTIAMSVAKDFENFFFTSAQTVLASDPVDVETSSTKVSNLYCAVAQAQGLVVFSEYEQYLIYSESGVISPSDVIIRTVSQYESDKTTPAKDTGGFIAFVTKTPGYSKILGMQPRGNQESAEVSDISKIVSGYLPPDCEQLIVNAQDSLLGVLSPSLNTLFFYKYFSDGKEVAMQAWFKWKVPGQLEFTVMLDNYLILLIREGGQYRVLLIDTVQDPYSLPEEVTQLVTTFATTRLDHYFLASAGGTITYDSVSKKSTIPKPYNHITTATPIAVTIPTAQKGTANDYDTIYTQTFTQISEANFIGEIEVDGSGNWLLLGDWTGKENNLVVGYRFDFDVELPRYFYRQQNDLDWSGSLTIARMRFDIGLTGSVNFFVSKYGSPDWRPAIGVQYANYYVANNPPIIDRTTLTVPIHQKNTNFSIKVNSNSPFPVSLNGMKWEGNYAPRYYRRA